MTTIGPENLEAHELIGLEITVKASSDPTLVGVAGIVRDETRNTLVIETEGRLKTIPKANTALLVESRRGGQLSIEGTRLAFRPEDRVRRGFARWP